MITTYKIPRHFMCDHAPKDYNQGLRMIRGFMRALITGFLLYTLAYLWVGNPW